MTGDPTDPFPVDGQRAEGAPTVDPIDWATAERLAHRVAGHEPFAASYHRESLERDFEELTARAGELVADFTGLEPSVAVARGRVLDRREWVSANLASFRLLLRPLTDRLGGRLAASPLAGMNRGIAGAEAGVLLGWFARRVLGQYDLMMTDTGLDTTGGGSVYYVGPNILGLEKRFDFRPRDFRLWIALHEVTHLVQFTGVPWLRDYFLDLVDQALTLAEPDPSRLLRAARDAFEELRAGRNPLEQGGLLNLLATPEQRDVMNRVQALMALLEGHGNFVMDRLGDRHVEGQARMSRILRERREGRGFAGQVQKALGIELKLRQYAVGEQFLAGIEREADTEALGFLWESEDRLPDLDELREPRRWLERQGLAVR